MKTILTIDFDIIMEPSIALYNEIVPGQSWQNLLTYPQMQLLQINPSHYEKLSVLLDILSHNEKLPIYFIDNHDRVVSYLPEDEQFNLINIDHHHDLGYKGNEDTNEINCSNWVKQLYNQERINEYTWINNACSLYPIEEDKELLTYDISLEMYNINLMPIPDMVFVCLSPPWVPPQYVPLFTTWVRLTSMHQHKTIDIDHGVYENEKSINN